MNGNTMNTTSNYVHLQIYGQDNTKLRIKILKDVPFQHLIDAYCNRTGIQKDSVKFLFDGKVLYGDKNIISLELEDNDVIETYISQNYNTSDHVRVKLLGLENIVVELKVKKHIPLENLKIAYSQYLHLQRNSIVFKFDNKIIRDEDTVSSIGLKDDNIILIYRKRK